MHVKIEYVIRRLLLLLVSLICALALTSCGGDDATATSDTIPGGRIPQLQGEIAIDGVLDDAAWAGALVQEIAYDIQPGDNTPPLKEVRPGHKVAWSCQAQEPQRRQGSRVARSAIAEGDAQRP